MVNESAPSPEQEALPFAGAHAAGESPTVSVIIPCYNAARWIRDALNSVVSQRDVTLEVVVVDDGSTDKSAALIQNEYPWVHLIRTENRGASSARNLALNHVSGRFVQFLDADDTLPLGKLALQVSLLEHTGADIAYCDWQHLTLQPDGTWVAGPVISRYLSDEPELDLCGQWMWPVHAYLFRRSFLDQRRIRFNLQLPVIQDGRFTQDCAYAGAEFVHCGELVAQYRMHSTGQNSRRSTELYLRDRLTNASEIESRWRSDASLWGIRLDVVLAMYGGVARVSYPEFPRLFNEACMRFQKLRPDYVPNGPWRFRLIVQLLGYRRAEWVAGWHRRISRGLIGAAMRRSL